MDAALAAIPAVAEEAVRLALRAGRLVVDVLGPHALALEDRARGDAQIEVVLAGTGVPEAPPDRSAEGGTLAQALLAAGLSRRDVVEQLTARLGIARNEAYRMVMEIQ